MPHGGDGDFFYVLERDMESAVKQRRTLAASVIAWAARGLAPTRRNWLTIGIANIPCGCVARVQADGVVLNVRGDHHLFGPGPGGR